MKTKNLRTLALLLMLSMAFIFSGCSKKSKDDSQIPWSRQAEWEGGMPGFAPGGGF